MFGSRRRRIGLIAGLLSIAVLVAVIALVSGGGADSPDRPDPYTVSANRLCRRANREIAETRRKHQKELERGEPGEFARPMFWIVGGVRARLGELDIPSDRRESAQEMYAAMLAYEGRLIALFRVTTPTETRAYAGEAEADARDANDAAAAMDVTQCAELDLSLGPRLR
jgi:hypothetical protein